MCIDVIQLEYVAVWKIRKPLLLGNDFIVLFITTAEEQNAPNEPVVLARWMLQLKNYYFAGLFKRKSRIRKPEPRN